jgi:large subunit ribosomal protein L27
MAHKKAGGSTSLGRDSQGQRLGIKLYAGEKAFPGAIIIRQRGTKYYPGEGVRLGGDDTIFALKQGTVKFSSRKLRRFDGALKKKTIVSVV